MFNLWFLTVYVAIFSSVHAVRKKICVSSPELKIVAELHKSMNIETLTLRYPLTFYVEKLGPVNEGWQPGTSLKMVDMDTNSPVFIYKFADHKFIKITNRLVRFVHKNDSKSLEFDLKFYRDKDEETRWEIVFQNEMPFKETHLCVFVVRSDDTPFVTMTNEAVNKRWSKANYYDEGDIIRFICSLENAKDLKVKPNFWILFPPRTDIMEAPIFPERDNKRIVIIMLSLAIVNNNVSCYVAGGDNYTDSVTLKFKIQSRKPMKDQIYETYAALIAIVVIFMVIMGAFGSWTLIVQQRRSTTKRILKHFFRSQKPKRFQKVLTQESKAEQSEQINSICEDLTKPKLLKL